MCSKDCETPINDIQEDISHPSFSTIQKNVVCPVCDKDLTTKQFNEHLRKQHKNDWEQNRDEFRKLRIKTKCLFCDKRVYHLLEHTKNKHKDQLKEYCKKRALVEFGQKKNDYSNASAEERIQLKIEHYAEKIKQI